MVLAVPHVRHLGKPGLGLVDRLVGGVKLGLRCRLLFVSVGVIAAVDHLILHQRLGAVALAQAPVQPEAKPATQPVPSNEGEPVAVN